MPISEHVPAQIVVLPSLDYEVFHGRNFADATTVLFEPTRRILERGTRCGIPFTLFADFMCIPAYRTAGDAAFCDAFETQLQWAVEHGHDVQPHTHPHWASSARCDGVWQLQEDRVTMADYGFESGKPRAFLREGVAYLRELLRPVDAEYDCVAFRAGGLALEPGRAELLQILADCGVTIDSTLAKGLQLSMDTLSIDYRDLPDTANWRLRTRSGDELFEIPIATFEAPLLRRLGFLIRRVRAIKERRGAGLSRAKQQTRLANALSLVRENMRYLSGRPVFLFSADTKGFTRSMLVEGFKRYVATREGNGETMYVSMINHPKLMFERQEHLLFDVLEDLQAHYEDRLRFATYRQAAQELGLTKAVLVHA